MTTYWITFRLADGPAGGRSYDTRYQALVDAVETHRTVNWWYDTTSFWLIDSASSRDQIASSIRAAIAPAQDLALIGSMEYKDATLIGATKELEALKALIPLLKRD